MVNGQQAAPLILSGLQNQSRKFTVNFSIKWLEAQNFEFESSIILANFY
jgi:hypothetical protein